jgi:hypothetical protein
MNTHNELTIAYPTITSHQSYNLLEYQRVNNTLLKQTNNIDDDEKEIAYLTELELFITNTLKENQKKIQHKFRMIENSKNFDCSKIQELPDDMIGEIKSYLEPELKFTRKFSVLRLIHSGLPYPESVYTWLDKVPKKLIIDLIRSCDIYPSRVNTSDKKEEWCNVIYHQINLEFNREKYSTRIDKLIERHSYQYGRDKLVERWYKVVLHIYVFQKYRRELETKLKKTDRKIYELKNRLISVKKYI